jgi:Suppressor of fused protein (SUFU)
MDIRGYYESRYGEPDRIARFTTRQGRVLHIYKWRAEGNPEGVALYATDGARFIQQSGNSACEFFIGLLPEVDEIVTAVAEVAAAGNGSQSPPDIGDTVSLPFPLGVQGSIQTFLFSNGEVILPRLDKGNESIVFVKLVPLFPSELEFKKKFGEEALWDEFRARVVPFWSLCRERAGILAG